MSRKNLPEFGGETELSWKNNVSIQKVRPASLSEWDIIWNECGYSTYFHSREWAEIWSKYTKRKMGLAPFLILFSDGKRALLPFSCLKQDGIAQILNGTTRLYVSSPECTYGGWISSDQLDNNHAMLLLNLIKKKFSNLSWRLNPYDNTIMESGIKISYEGETHAINLEKGFNEIASNMSKGHRSAVKQAIRSGVSVRLASSIEDWISYYQVYETSVDRWGNRLLGEKYSWDLFHEIYLRNSPNVELWLSIYLDRVISGALCFHSRKHFVYWHGASVDTYFNLRPVNLLLYEVIKEACEKKYAWFDFNPSGGLNGVKAFKERFGAQAFRCPIIELRPKNMRTFVVEKATNVVIEIKKRTSCTL
jgi:hypothetical protein